MKKRDKKGRFIKTRFNRFCIDCNKSLKSYSAKRCPSCASKEKYKNFVPPRVKKYSKKSRLKMRMSHLGKPSGNKGKKHGLHSEETLRKMRGRTPWNKGKKLPHLSGEKSPMWKGGYRHKLFCNHRRRIMKLNAEGVHTEREWNDLKKKYNYKCVACGRSENEIVLTEDHIMPLSKGGSDYINNIQPLCKSCNCKKHDKYKRFI